MKGAKNNVQWVTSADDGVEGRRMKKRPAACRDGSVAGGSSSTIKKRPGVRRLDHADALDSGLGASVDKKGNKLNLHESLVSHSMAVANDRGRRMAGSSKSVEFFLECLWG
jgi:hypothetical protein